MAESKQGHNQLRKSVNQLQVGHNESGNQLQVCHNQLRKSSKQVEQGHTQIGQSGTSTGGP